MSALTLALVMWLPLHVPVPYRPTISASYMAGFNNSVAILLAAAISSTVLVGTLYRRRHRATETFQDAPDQKLTARFIAVVMGAAALLIAAGSVLVARSHMRYLADAGYFIEQATVRLETGRSLYTQIEFAYGPLLVLPAVWLSKLLHCRIETGYYISLVFESALGLGLIAYSLNELPIRRGLRRAGLLLLTFGAVTPFLGNNYTFLRFAAPMAVVLFATRQRSPWRCAAVLAAGQAVCLLISPELGIALLATIFFFAVLRSLQSGLQWLATAVLPVGAVALVLLALGPSFLAAFSHFSRGSLSLPVGPYPHVLIFLFALVWLVPVGLGRMTKLRNPESARLLTLYVLGVSYLPAALGRCDPLHVFFNGTVFFVLALLVVSPAIYAIRRGWVLGFAALVLWTQFVNYHIFVYRSAHVLALTVMPHVPRPVRDPILRVLDRRQRILAKFLRPSDKPDPVLDAALLDRVVGREGVATPIVIRHSSEDVLRETHRYRPPYEAFWVNLLGPEDEKRSIDEFNSNRFALLPATWEGNFVETPKNIWMVQGMRLPYRVRHPLPYNPGALFRKNLQERWRPVAQVGPEILYRRVD